MKSYQEKAILCKSWKSRVELLTKFQYFSVFFLQVGEAKKRLSCLTSSPMSPLDSDDSEGGGQEGLKKSNRSSPNLKIGSCCGFMFSSEGLTSSSKLSSSATQ